MTADAPGPGDLRDIPAIPETARLFGALEATWPPAGGDLVGPFRLRRGAGGGQRVSAAVWSEGSGPVDAAQGLRHVSAAEARMAGWGQVPLFMLRGPAEAPLDAVLDRLGYRQKDPSLLLVAPAADLARLPLGPLRAILAAPSLAICREIWAEGGIGGPRQAVIARTPRPVCAVVGRRGDHPAGAALVAVDGPIALLHALHVRPAHRCHGVARAMVQRAARWAEARGCGLLAVAVLAANAPARGLFATLGFREAAAYHYRVAPGAGS